MAPKYDAGFHYDAPTVRYDEPQPSPKKMDNTPVTYPVNEVLGMAASAKQMLTNYKTQMIAAKVDPTDLIATLGTDHDTLAVENDKQEGLKTQLRDQTTTVEGVKADTYAHSSKACDMIITAFGRNSEQAQEAMNLRKSVRPSPHKTASAAAKTKPTP